MTKSLDFVETSVWVDTSKFSDKAKAQGWVDMTTNLIKALAKVLDVANRLNNYERADAVCTTYDGLYGADELCFNLTAENRRKQIASSTYDYYTNSGGFYLTAYQMATKMWGFDTTELPEDYFVSTPRFASSYHPDYSETITLLEAQGVSVGDYWKVERYIPEDSSDGTFKVYDTSTFFNGVTVWYGMNSATQHMGTIHQLLAALYHYRSHFLILRKLMELTPASRGGKTFPASYSTRDCLYSFPSVQPHEIVRIRQALTKVRQSTQYAGYINYLHNHQLTDAMDQGDHEGYGPGDGVCDICDEHTETFESMIEDELVKRGINIIGHYFNPKATEIPDRTRDITVYTGNATIEEDPLYVAGTGAMPMYDVNNQLKITLGVTLMRKYAAKRLMVAWDYKESTNPNAFEAAAGKANYRLSNMRSWLNSERRGMTGWKVKTHEYDDFWAGGQEGYMCAISETLRSNLAKTIITYNEQKTATAIQNKQYQVGYSEDWAFIPDIYDYNNQIKGWTNFVMGGYAAFDETLYEPIVGRYEGLANDLYLYDMAYSEDGTYANKRYYTHQGINPNFKGDDTDYSGGMYLMSRNYMLATADSRDASVPNRVADYVVKPPFDGTGKNSAGASIPSNYGPTHYCVTLVGFRAEENDGVPKTKCNGPTLTY